VAPGQSTLAPFPESYADVGWPSHYQVPLPFDPFANVEEDETGGMVRRRSPRPDHFHASSPRSPHVRSGGKFRLCKGRL
jgi:hypothetical protein